MAIITNAQAGNNQMLDIQPNIDMARQRGLAVFMGCVFVLLLLNNQVSSVGCQDTSAAVPINCTTNDTQYLYEKVKKALWSTEKRPVQNPNKTLNIKIGITIFSILGVREKDQVLMLFIVRTLDWFVPFLRWNSTECGTEKISYPKSDLWLPDIQIIEFADEDKSPVVPYLQLNFTGGIHLVEPKRVVSSCKMNIYRFPFDVQKCLLTFVSVVHEVDEISLSSKSNEFIFESSVHSDSGWSLVNVTQRISVFNLSSKRSYSSIEYNIVLKREPSLYVVNLLVPGCFLSLLDLFSFFLPPQNIDRSAFKMTLILGYTVFLIITNDLLPDGSTTTPLINVFFSLSLALMVASLLETMFIVNLSSRNGSNYYSRVPRWLHVLVLGYLARLLFMSPKRPGAPTTLTLNPQAQATLGQSTEAMAPKGEEEMEEMEGATMVDELKKLAQDVLIIRLRMEESLRPDRDNDDWKLIANIIDRLLFLLYVLFVIVSYMTIIVIWVNHEVWCVEERE